MAALSRRYILPFYEFYEELYNYVGSFELATINFEVRWEVKRQQN